MPPPAPARSKPQNRPLPVTRSNFPPIPYGTPAGMRLPPQAMMGLTAQQLALQNQARSAQMQHKQARLAYQHRQQQQHAKTTLNKNGKRPREQPQRYTGGPDFGALVPERLHKSHGHLFKAQPAWIVTPRLAEPHCISQDLMDALHVGDKGLFLACDAGFHYYIWRYAVRLDNPQKHIESNMFGSIEPFHMSFPNNQMQTLRGKHEIAFSYSFFYASWENTTLRGHGFTRFFASLACKMGLVKREQWERALQRIRSFLYRAKEIWNITPFNPDDALCYLRASEEFWWVDSHLPETIRPKPKPDAAAAESLQNPIDRALECLYRHEIDAESTDKHFGHLDRSIRIWSQPRITTTSWAARCNNRSNVTAKHQTAAPRKDHLMPAEQVWTHQIKSNTLYDRIGLDRYFVESTNVGLRPISMDPIGCNLHLQAVEWLRTAGPHEDRDTFTFFDHERAFKEELCIEDWPASPRTPTPEPGPNAIDIDSDMDAEGEEDDEPPVKHFWMDLPRELKVSSTRLNTSPSSSTKHDHGSDNLNCAVNLSPGNAYSEVIAVRRDSGTEVMRDAKSASPGSTNVAFAAAAPSPTQNYSTPLQGQVL